ncbi:MAG: T9SS type A sorting domain-containing protein [Candidatus Eisenbacteria bacterium]|uniref:T9SS type A sorting domain-containing protein n=1 Tax=Eiseniibacteriota bacterium TaxID=2212470 RepID=A0A7Y2E8U3_UNCEI|nr:T9SS type A sorting domain-containing protein [Candidatus Eisenbacteria bacterium]
MIFSEAKPVPVLLGSLANAGVILRNPVKENHQGFVAGRILDPTGEGIEGAKVRVFLSPSSSRTASLTALTNAAGWFLVRDVPLYARVVIAAEAEGYVPRYYPGVYAWQSARRVDPGGPGIETRPAIWSLDRAQTSGELQQAGRLNRWLEEDPGGNLTPEELAEHYHLSNIRHGYLYLYDLTRGAGAPPVAGTISADNGTAVLAQVSAGDYYARADRPGFESRYLEDSDGNRVVLKIGPNTFNFAEILLPSFTRDPDPPDPNGGQIQQARNAPNPFVGATTISYLLREAVAVSIDVFDIHGGLVRRVLADTPQSSGRNTTFWDATDHSGRRVSSGVYFYRIQAGRATETRKMVVLP